MRELPQNIINMLTEFLVCEIGSRAIDGITYCLLFKSEEKDMETYRRYLKIKVELDKVGYSSDQVFRIHELCNGYILDMDLNIAKVITAKILSTTESGKNNNVVSLFKDMPEQRRMRDLQSLANKIKKQYDSGKTSKEYALFNRNSTNRIIIHYKSNSENCTLNYDAYAIRHWDIEILNEKFLIPAGIRVCRIQPCEILPSKTGVAFRFDIESIDRFVY